MGRGSDMAKPPTVLCRLNVCVPPDSRVEALPPSMIELGEEALRRQLGLDEIRRVGHSRWD